MLYAVVGLVVLASIGVATYALIKKSELVAQIAALQEGIEEQDASYSAEIDGLKSGMASTISAHQKELREQVDRHSKEIHVLKSELAKLEKFRSGSCVRRAVPRRHSAVVRVGRLRLECKFLLGQDRRVAMSKFDGCRHTSRTIALLSMIRIVAETGGPGRNVGADPVTREREDVEASREWTKAFLL